MNNRISVKTRLPPPGVIVWLFGRHGEGVLKGREFHCKGYFFADGSCVEQHGLDTDVLPALKHITHWAPLAGGLGEKEESRQ